MKKKETQQNKEDRQTGAQQIASKIFTKQQQQQQQQKKKKKKHEKVYGKKRKHLFRKNGNYKNGRDQKDEKRLCKRRMFSTEANPVEP